MDLCPSHSFCRPSSRTKRSWFRLLANLSGRLAFSALFSAALLVIFSTKSAHAEFTVCNQTLDVVNLAVGQKVDNADQTDGWWTIGANQCVNVIRDELANRYIYLYATDVFGHAILNGSTEMCIERRRFSIRGI